GEGEGNYSTEVPDSTLPRKASSEGREVPVPQTDTGRRGENPKVIERTLVKGTRQNDPVTSGEGVLLWGESPREPQ
ncbi:hypothetical protein ACA29_04480, partial [Lederbergia galactosidilytica]